MDKEQEFDDDTIAALKELGQALRAIHDRLIAEVYTIINGKYVPSTNH